MRISNAAGAPNTPAMDLYYRINKDVLGLPGVRSMRFYGSARPNELGVVAVDARAAAALLGALEPSVGGVALKVYVDGDTKNPYVGPEGPLRDRMALIDAMTGVWGHRASIMQRGSGTVTFWTTNQAVVDRVDPILRDRYDMGVDSRGWRVYVNVRWKPGVPA